MGKVETGQFVSVHYKGTLQNGEVFDTSEGRRPLEFQTGAGQLIKGFEDAVIGMSLNEKKEFTLMPEDAYGMRDESRLQVFPRSDLPASVEPTVRRLELDPPSCGDWVLVLDDADVKRPPPGAWRRRSLA